MLLPLNQPLARMQTIWKAILDPFLKNPLNGTRILSNVQLNNGTTVINHGLAKVQQGWFLTDIQSAATIYRSAAFNDLTLTITSNAKVTVSIGVF